MQPDPRLRSARQRPEGTAGASAGFSYAEVSPAGSALTNGELVPDWHDGIAAFTGPNDTTIPVRNNEITDELTEDDPILGVPAQTPYDGESFGGTTVVVLNADRTVIDSYVASSETLSDCAGGPAPWETWRTCGEITSA